VSDTDREDPLVWLLLLERGRQTGDFDLAAAAKAAGKSRQALEKLYKKGVAKLGQSAQILKPKTQRLPYDRRGQAQVADSQDA